MSQGGVTPRSKKRRQGREETSEAAKRISKTAPARRAPGKPWPSPAGTRTARAAAQATRGRRGSGTRWGSRRSGTPRRPRLGAAPPREPRRPLPGRPPSAQPRALCRSCLRLCPVQAPPRPWPPPRASPLCLRPGAARSPASRRVRPPASGSPGPRLTPRGSRPGGGRRIPRRPLPRRRRCRRGSSRTGSPPVVVFVVVVCVVVFVVAFGSGKAATESDCGDGRTGLKGDHAHQGNPRMSVYACVFQSRAVSNSELDLPASFATMAICRSSGSAWSFHPITTEWFFSTIA